MTPHFRPRRHAGAVCSFALGLASVGACSSDLFHSTEWPTKCDADPDTCTTTSPSSSGAGGLGGGGAPNGGAAQGGFGGSGGVAGAGGVTGSGGAGGACTTCPSVLASGVMPAVWCTGSKDLYAALETCRCGAGCATACALVCMGQPPPTTECITCENTNCSLEVTGCENDPNGP